MSGFDAVPEVGVDTGEGTVPGTTYPSRGGVAHPEPVDVTIELISPPDRAVEVSFEDGPAVEDITNVVDVRLVLPD